jgi:hypothetical protein
MSLFSFFKKIFKKGGRGKMTTLDEVKKAYEDLSEDDKKSFHQSIADRVHESVAAQEEDSGDKDSQSAEDREHEALGAEHADGEGETEEIHETDPEDKGDGEETDKDDKPEAKEEPEEEPKEDAPEKPSDIEARLASLEVMVKKLVDQGEKKDRESEEASEDENVKLRKLEQIYNS